MAAAAPAAPSGNATITLRNETWTAESARLLLEVDEGWVGFRGDFAWSWHDNTFMVYSVICRERNWPCKSQATSVAMLMALRAGGISMKFSNTTRTADGFAQWSLIEMRELGAQMRGIVDGRSPAMRWAAQLLAFVETMKTVDINYSIGDRTVEDFASRASKYIPEAIVMLIDPHKRNGKASLDSRDALLTPILTSIESTRSVVREQSTGNAMERRNEPFVSGVTRRVSSADPVPIETRTMSGGRTTGARLDTHKTYRGPTLEDEELWWVEETIRRDSRSSESSTQEVTSREQVPPHEAQLASGRPYLGQNRLPSPRRDTYGLRVGGNLTNRSTRKNPRAQHSLTSDFVASNGRASTAPPISRSENLYARPEKPWGEFVAEVLLAERMARNEDELDYWHFVRSLYEI